MNRRLKQLNGLKFVFGGVTHTGWIPSGAAEPKPTPVKETVLNLQIEEGEGSFFLLWESSNPEFMSSDSWHETLDDALDEAERSFGVKRKDWSDA